MSLNSLLHILVYRAEWLIIILLVAFFLGELLARLIHFPAFLARGRAVVATLGRKLDRPNRGIATLVYRGIIALTLLLIPAVMVGVVLSRHVSVTELLAILWLIAWFGYQFGTLSGWKLWRRAKADHTPLELPHLDYLFPDAHAVLRYSISTRAEAFAVGIVGACFWYLIGGLPAAFVYLTLAAAHAQFRSPVFGWAAHGAFRLADLLPRLVARVLLTLAALFVPRTHPLKSLKKRRWAGFVAALFDVTLGGPGPGGERPWVGDGTARLTPQHLRASLLVQGVASVLLLLLLAHHYTYKHLIDIAMQVSAWAQ